MTRPSLAPGSTPDPARPRRVEVGHDVDLGTAANHASSAVPVAGPAESADQVWVRLRGQRYDSAAVIAIVAGDDLRGVVALERLLAAAPGAVMADLMDTNPPIVHLGTHQEHAAWAAVQHGEPGLAVVDDKGRYHGLIAPQTLLQVLLDEHEEDLARLGGYLASSTAARTASTEPIGRRFLHRVPWLLLGLAGALFAAGVVGAFEEQLRAEVLVAYFVPGVVYIADAVGTQTETLIIRGLSLNIALRRVVVQELVTGVLLGLSLALLSLPLVWAVWGEADVALAVGAATFAASGTATITAMALPWVIQRLGRDPAYGSGPLATVIQDILSVTVYFGAAALIVF